MPAINPTKARLKSCTINGLQLRNKTRRVTIRESVCSAYLTGDLIIYDDNNVINSLGLVGGEPITVSFDAPPNRRSYDAQMMLLGIKGEPSPDNLKMVVYTISMVGSEYFSDRSGLVQKSARNTTGATLAQQIWNETMGSSLRIPVQDGMISDGQQPFTIRHVKPLTALFQIRERMMFPQYKTGNTLLYRDRDGSNLVPLEHLFSTLSAQQTFIQKGTWGANWRDIFESDNAIIYAAVQTRDQNGNLGGRSSAQEVAASARQGKRVFDIAAGKLINNNIFGAQVPSGKVSGIAGSIFGSQGQAGSLGGKPNIQMTDSSRQTTGQDFTQKTEAERLYAATVKAGPQYILKVPLQTGINCTVGKGINAQLQPPSGDQGVGRQSAGGLMLVTDLIHEVYNEQRLVQGTTTLQCLKGGFDA